MLIAVKDCKSHRIGEIRQRLTVKRQQQDQALKLRRERLLPNCLICGAPVLEQNTAYFFCETSDGQISGFLEESCFSDLIFRYFYRSQKEISPSNPLRELFRESAQRSYFVMRLAAASNGFEKSSLAFHRYDDEGLEISQKTIEIKEFKTRFLHREKTKLYRLIEATFLAEQVAQDSFLLIRRVDSFAASGMLLDEHRAAFQQTMTSVANKLR